MENLPPGVVPYGPEADNPGPRFQLMMLTRLRVGSNLIDSGSATPSRLRLAVKSNKLTVIWRSMLNVVIATVTFDVIAAVIARKGKPAWL